MRRDRKRRILMLVENNPYPQDLRVRHEAEALRNAGYEVSVISQAAEGQPRTESVHGVHVYRYPEPFEASGFLGYVWEFGYSTVAMFVLSLVVWIRRGFDVIHAANPPDTLFAVAAFHKIFGKRFIFDHHDLSPELYRANFGSASSDLAYKVLTWLEIISCRLADHVIATNESYKQVEMERAGIPAERITIVRNGPDLEHYPFVETNSVPSADGRTMIAYVGSMGTHDGIDFLLRAFKHLVEDLGRTDWMGVLIGGKGAALAQLKVLRTKLGLDSLVTFTGWISEEEKMELLSRADICVDPDPLNSFNDRSTMIKVAEYMALGKPIVAFDLKENRHTAQDAAILVPGNDEMLFAQALAELMDNPERRRQMGAYGRQRVEEELAWGHSVPKLLTAYRAVFAGTEEPGLAVEELVPPKRG